MPCHLVCGLLAPDQTSENHRKARSLTVSWLRWGYTGDIVEGTSVDDILNVCASRDFDYCFILGAGMIVRQQRTPEQDEAAEFFPALSRWVGKKTFLVCGEVLCTPERSQGLRSRWLLVDLRRYREFGCPKFAGKMPVLVEGRDSAESASESGKAPEFPEGARLIQASLEHQLKLHDLAANLRELLADLGPDLNEQPGFVEDLIGQSDRLKRGVFPWNFEPYADVAESPADWRGPISTLYSVAAGLKPNMILNTHGFAEDTEVVFFDYSAYELEFRKLLCSEWDGIDYPGFLKYAAGKLPSDAYYALPGVSAGDPMMDELWRREVSLWGGEKQFQSHWSRYRKLRHRFVVCNLLTEQESILKELSPAAGTVMWWSNAFATVYTACHYCIEEKQALYESWIRALALKAPEMLLYGSDHSNSSVNGMNARDYLTAYEKAGGDPLKERRLNRRAIHF